MTTSPEACAQEILDVVPVVMRTIRAELRRHRAADLSVPQFRTLAYIDRNADASLSDVAEHIGLTLPSMSKIVDGLVTRKLVTRQTAHDDRRRMTLALTARGLNALETSRAATRACLAEDLSVLTERERETIKQAMQILRPVFTPSGETSK
ncbi:MAG TPA: MarR family winged helix-turn-helix transcriptional regulator [Anaerolineae bacterium]|nr:MarR family winged helix-turn-helix transcriptional regulator [Anaerolineae bacterium]